MYHSILIASTVLSSFPTNRSCIPWLLFLVSCSTVTAYYDEYVAIRLFHLAASSYGSEHEECVSRTFQPHENRRLLATTTQECDVLSQSCSFVVVHSDTLRETIIAFRGTKTKTQLLAEGWQSLTPTINFFDMGNVNPYFMNAHLSLWPQIEELIRDPKYLHYNVVFTGHSLGGALATLAAARTVRQGYRQSHQVSVLTFGEPRVGTVAFARNFDRIIPDCYRVVHAGDIVPHLPPCAKNLTGEMNNVFPCDPNNRESSYHQGKEIWYPENMLPGARYIECNGQPINEDFKCSDHIKFHFDDLVDSVKEHRNYFGYTVSDHGRSGCKHERGVDPSKKRIQSAIHNVNSFLKRLGFNK